MSGGNICWIFPSDTDHSKSSDKVQTKELNSPHWDHCKKWFKKLFSL